MSLRRKVIVDMIDEFLNGGTPLLYVAFLWLAISIAVYIPKPDKGKYSFSHFKNYYLSFKRYLSPKEFKEKLIVLTVLLALFQCGIGIFFPDYSEYIKYRNARNYITSLPESKQLNLQKALLTQKYNIEKKYGLDRSKTGDRNESAEAIAEKNTNRYGVYLNPLQTTVYFDEDAYAFNNTMRWGVALFFLLLYYSCIYRRFRVTPLVPTVNGRAVQFSYLKPLFPDDWRLENIQINEEFNLSKISAILGKNIVEEKMWDSIYWNHKFSFHFYEFPYGKILTANNRITHIFCNKYGVEVSRDVKLGISTIIDVFQSFSLVVDAVDKSKNLIQYTYFDRCMSSLTFCFNAEGVLKAVDITIKYSEKDAKKYASNFPQ